MPTYAVLALQQVVRYLRYIGRGADAGATVAHSQLAAYRPRMARAAWAANPSTMISRPSSNAASKSHCPADAAFATSGNSLARIALRRIASAGSRPRNGPLI